MSKTSGNSAVETDLRTQIETSRQNLSDSLAALTYELQPKVQVGYVADDLKYKAKETSYKIATTVDEAREGNREAMKKILVSAGVIAGVVGLCVLKRIIRKHRR